MVFCLSPCLSRLSGAASRRSSSQRSQRILFTAEAQRSLRTTTFSLAAETPASENLLTLRGWVDYASEFVAYLITLLRLHSTQTLANLKRKRHAVAEPLVFVSVSLSRGRGNLRERGRQKRKRIFPQRTPRLCGGSAVTTLCGLCALCERFHSLPHAPCSMPYSPPLTART